MKAYDEVKDRLQKQFQEIEWIPESGINPEALEARCAELTHALTDCSKALIKAKTFEMIAYESRIAIDKDDLFQDKLFDGNLMKKQRSTWEKESTGRYRRDETEDAKRAWDRYGSYQSIGDYGHTSPNSELLLKLGFPGLLKRAEMYSKRSGLTEKQKEYYESLRIVLESMIHVAERLSDAIEPYHEENARALSHIAKGVPETLYEAMQLLVLYFFLHEYVAGTRVRTLGRLDVLLTPFYKKDLEEGRLTEEEVRELFRFFLNKFWSAKVPYDLPFCLGGMDDDGQDVTNELSSLIVEVYDGMNIYSPKIHIRVSEKTPRDFVKKVLSCVRHGHSSFVFVNDRIAIKSLENAGIPERDARHYVPIGCYEPAVWGREIGCTGNGGVNLAKAVELVFTNGRDSLSGDLIGVETGVIRNYREFVDAVKTQIAFLTDRAVTHIIHVEHYYGDINPDPILSCQYDRSVEAGVDVYEGGAQYNNSSLYFYAIATLTDSMIAVKKLVFERKMVSFRELGEILKSNWTGREDIRTAAKMLPEKYGNNEPEADAIAVEMSEYAAGLILGKPNGRGGVFKPALFSIDFCFPLGEKTMATPDGRKRGEPLSKNLSAVTGMDRKGITALVDSVTKIDFTKFPTGSVLDVLIHPSAVSGEDGLDAFYGLLITYFQKGGFAMHGNVFSSEELKKAQENPEQYRNLQVRVCGWNAYFVDLSRKEQDSFIKQAENNEG